MEKDFSKCHCSHAGWCELFKKEMTFDPPNWQWCKSLPVDQRVEYYNSINNQVRVIHKATNIDDVDIINFYDELPEKLSDYAVCVIAVNDTALDLLKITREKIQAYAHKCNADYIELTGDQIPSFPIYNKFRLYQITTVYKKTLYIDCDIVVKKNTPNIFELTPDDKISAFDEFSEYIAENRADWAKLEIEKAVAKFHLESKKDTMLNSGFMVIPQACAEYYKQPDRPYYKSWVFDQVYLTICTPEAKLYKLGKEWNNTYDLKSFIDNVGISYINHVNIGNKTDEHYNRKKILQTLVDYDEMASEYIINPHLPKIVTSISCNANSFTRQVKAINTWKQNGFYVISCNTPEEIHKLKTIYPYIDEFKEISIQEFIGFKSTPNIYDLCQVSSELNQKIILINSDIEICDVNIILDALKNTNDHELIVGIRYNYNDQVVSREKYGIDFYVITPDIAKSIPRLEQRIGMPFWDYWLVAHFFVKNYTIKVLADKFLLHELHQLNWSQEQWNIGYGNFRSYYNNKVSSIIGDGYHFRNCLGHGPDRFHTLIFDHIEKTAGTTIKTWACESFFKDSKDKTSHLVYVSNNRNDAEYFIENTPMHMREIVKIIYGHHVWPLLDYCNKSKFMFVAIRDPFERFISHVSYSLRLNKHVIKDLSTYIREFADYYFNIYYNHMTCGGTVDWKTKIDQYDYIDNHDNTLRISKILQLAFPNQIRQTIDKKLNTCDNKIKLSYDDIVFVKKELEQEYEIYHYMRSKMKEINSRTINNLKNNLHLYINAGLSVTTDQQALDYIGYDDKYFDEFL